MTDGDHVHGRACLRPALVVLQRLLTEVPLVLKNPGVVIGRRESRHREREKLRRPGSVVAVMDRMVLGKRGDTRGGRRGCPGGEQERQQHHAGCESADTGACLRRRGRPNQLGHALRHAASVETRKGRPAGERALRPADRPGQDERLVMAGQRPAVGITLQVEDQRAAGGSRAWQEPTRTAAELGEQQEEPMTAGDVPLLVGESRCELVIVQFDQPVNAQQVRSALAPPDPAAPPRAHEMAQALHEIEARLTPYHPPDSPAPTG